MKRVFLQFSFRQGWFCQFLEEDRKTLNFLPMSFHAHRYITLVVITAKT